MVHITSFENTLNERPDTEEHVCMSPFRWNVPNRQVHAAAAAAKSLQSCPTLGDPTDSSPPGSPVPGILQARTPECVAIYEMSRTGKSIGPENRASLPRVVVAGNGGEE